MRLLAGALVFAFALPAAAETVRSEVDVRKLGVQDQLTLTLTVEGATLPDNAPSPVLTNLRVVGGPAVSTQMSWVNGQSTQSRSWTYLLAPKAVGRAEVGALKLGDSTAPAIPIEVVAGSVPRAAPPLPQRSLDPFQDLFGRGRGTARREAKLFVEARPSRTTLFVGEPVVLTYYLYTQASVVNLNFVAPPQFTGFWAEDLPEPRGSRGGEPVDVDGVAYRRFPLYVKLLFPTRAGKLTIPASSFRLELAPSSFFDPGAALTRATEPVTLEVKPLPEEPGFSGAVGKFQASASLDRTDLAFGDAATLRFRVEGSGNLKWVDRGPELSIPGAKVYPPQLKSDLRTGPGGMSGSRTWEFVVVPQTAGSLEVPPLSFSYFDPASDRIVRTSTAPIHLAVAGGAVAGNAPPPPPGAVAAGGPLRLRTELGPAPAAALPGKAVAGIALAALLVHGLLWGGGRITGALRGRPAAATGSRSARGALRDLQRVGRETMSKEAAALLIEKNLYAVFGSLDGDDGERARAVRGVLAEVHAVRYAPQLGDYSERLRALSLRAAEVVRRWA
ncbi:MAG TPA: BatD family protein [Candidatus Polarisedimenticolaceae bacterium]|nr:BatD family protein [Candidatus Polarisedimenticolaceae bacterium]